MTIGVIVSTYNQPRWLALALEGWCQQLRAPDEVIIADDGSSSDTRDVIDSFRSRLNIIHVWHPDDGFRKTEILNAAILASTSDFLIFSDGDCIPRQDFVAVHERYARHRRFLSGGYFKLSLITSERITADAITADAITAGAITAGAITADAITAGAITADAITAGATTADAITADAITADAITSERITSSTITSNTNTSSLNPSTLNPSTLNPSPMNTSSLNPSPMNPSPMNPSPMNPSTLNPSTLNPSSLNTSSLNTSSLNPSTLNPSTLNPSTLNPSPMNPSLGLNSRQLCFDVNWLRAHGMPRSRKDLKLVVRGRVAAVLDALTTTRATWNGHNASAWRQDLLNVNGFDTRMKYGGEDRELGERLENAGVMGYGIRYRAICLHLDHARGYVNAADIARNDEIRAVTKKERLVRTAHGLAEQDLSNTLTLRGT